MNIPSDNPVIASALSAALSRYAARNPESARLHAAAAEVMPGGNTRTVLFYLPFPLYMVRGEGCRLWDADGHAYLDALGEYTAGLYGHSHPVIRRALEEVLKGGMNLSSHTAGEAALARELRRRFPVLELLRFTNSGTEANLLALSVACAHTARRKILVFDGAYHGGVLTFGGGGSPVNVPHDFLVAQYNDLASTRGLATAHASELAAILVEPMLGSGGCIPGDPAFLAGLRALADETGALLIFDEVMTSRLSPGGRQALLGIKPDLTTLGKYFGGGVSFGAFGGRADVMARFDPRRPDALAHAGTFNNNVLTMAAGLAGLKQVLTPAALAALNECGERLRAAANELFVRNGVALQFSGIGSLMNLHATDRPISHPADLVDTDSLVKELIFHELLARGVYMARRGFVALSLPFGDAEIAEFLAALDAVVGRFKGVLPARG